MEDLRNNRSLDIVDKKDTSLLPRHILKKLNLHENIRVYQMFKDKID